MRLVEAQRGDAGVGGGSEGGEERDEEEAEDEFRELVPEEGGLVVELGAVRGFAEKLALLVGPLDGVEENDEADEGVAAGLGEDGELACGVGVEGSGGGGLGGVVDGEAGPRGRRRGRSCGGRGR